MEYPLTELGRITTAMREAQKDYFKTRSKAALIRSKELEKKVDALLKELPQAPQNFIYINEDEGGNITFNSKYKITEMYPVLAAIFDKKPDVAEFLRVCVISWEEDKEKEVSHG